VRLNPAVRPLLDNVTLLYTFPVDLPETQCYIPSRTENVSDRSAGEEAQTPQERNRKN
jgi:hypothetical protein